MIIKKYTVDVLCKSLDYVNEVFTNLSPLQTIQVFQKEDGYVFKSNSNNISDGFKTTETKTLNKVFIGDYLIEQKEGTLNQELYLELLEDPRHLDDPKAFIRRYGHLFRTIKDGNIDIKEKEFKIYYVRLTEDRVYTSTQEDFYNVSDDYLEFAIVQETPKYLRRLGETLFVSKDQIVSLKEGYYNIYPRKFSEDSSSTYSEYSLNIFSSSYSKIQSRVKININDWILNKTTLAPNTKILIELTKDCINLLRTKEDFKDTKEYVLYKTKKEVLEPVCVLSSTGTEPTEEIKTLLNSHEEFLRSYSYLPNKAIVSINSEEVELYNKDFSVLKAKLLADNLPHYNFNL